MSARQFAETEAADPNPDKFLHFIANFVKHPADLTVDSLPQDDSEVGRLEYAQDINPRSLTVEHDAFQQLGCERWIPRPIESQLVLLFDLVSGMGEALGKIPVIGEKKKTFGLGVEPADVEQPRQMRREEIVNGVARIRVAPGRNESGRLMQHDVEALLPMNEFAVDFDVVAVGRLRAEIGADAAVNGDATGRNEFVAMPARTYSGRGKEPVQAHVFWRLAPKRPASFSEGRGLSGHP